MPSVNVTEDAAAKRALEGHTLKATRPDLDCQGHLITSGLHGQLDFSKVFQTTLSLSG